MSIRMIQPDEIRPGQTIALHQRWVKRGACEPFTKTWRGMVSAVNPASVRFDGDTSWPLTNHTRDFTVEITLIAEPPDPRKSVIVRTMMSSLDVAITASTAVRLTDRILANLDKMEEP